MSKYLVVTLCLYAALSACVNTVSDQLIITSKTVSVPQAKQFCVEHPGDSLCSQ